MHVCSTRIQDEMLSPPKGGSDREIIATYWIHALHAESPKGSIEELLLSC